MKDGEGINQRTLMHDPWISTTIWGLMEGVGRVRLGGGGKREKEKSSNNCNGINNTMFFFNFKTKSLIIPSETILLLCKLNSIFVVSFLSYLELPTVNSQVALC